MTLHWEVEENISSEARARIPSRTLLPSDHCAAVESFWLALISSRSSGRVLLLVEERGKIMVIGRGRASCDF